VPKLSAVRGQLARRFGWGLGDQMMCSLSNAALSFYVARELGAAQFGAFSIAYVTYSFALNASRGLATDPLIVRYSSAELPKWRRAVANSTGTAAVAGVLTGVIALAAAVVLRGNLGLAFLALGLTLPGLLLQDSWRYAFFALGRGSQAFLNDTIWTLSMLPVLAALRIAHEANVFWFVLAWGGTAGLAAAIGPLQARLTPKFSHSWLWVHLHRDLSARYLAENSANSAASQVRLYAVGAIAGLSSVGVVQAASLLMGPFLVIFMGISLVTVPEAARILRKSPKRFLPYCVIVGVGLAACGLLWGAFIYVALPHGLGQLLLKNLWRSAYPLVPAYTLWVAAGCLIGGATAGLRALGAARRSLRAMLIASALTVLGGVAGAYLAGAVGTVDGAAASTLTGALVWWWELRMAIRESPLLNGRATTTAGLPLTARAVGLGAVKATAANPVPPPSRPIGRPPGPPPNFPPGPRPGPPAGFPSGPRPGPPAGFPAGPPAGQNLAPGQVLPPGDSDGRAGRHRRPASAQ
jgi:O-antigen/teichoic acid export membrane protein